MGRGKLHMELITKVYSRSQTYQKRKKGLKKKALEFSTLCGVDTCMILYGPNHKGQTRKAEVWPDSPSEVFRIIGKYKAKAFDSHAVRSFDLFDFFSRRNKKIQDDILKLRKTNITAKFPTWNNSLNNLSLDQIKALLIKFDAVLEVVKMKVMMIKEDKRLIDESSIIPCINPINNFRKDSSLQKEMKPEAVSTYLKPYGAMQIMPQFSPADQTTLYNQIAVQQVDHHVNSLDHYNQMIMMMMVMNGSDQFTQFSCNTNNNNNNNNNNDKINNSFYSLSSSKVMKDVMFSNQMVRPRMCLYEPLMQPVPPFGHCNMMLPRPSNSSQVLMGSQFSEFYCGINEDDQSKIV